MAQGSYTIDITDTDVEAQAFFQALLNAVASTNSGATAPSETHAFMFWADSANDLLKMRNEANNAWIDVAYLDQAGGAFKLLEDTEVVDPAGTQTGIIGALLSSVWNAGTDATLALISPALLKGAIDALAPSPSGWPPRTEVLRVTTSGVTALQFTTDISQFKAVYLEGVLAADGASRYFSVQIREAAGTWREIGRTVTTASSANLGMNFQAVIENTNRDNASRLITLNGVSSRYATSFTVADNSVGQPQDTLIMGGVVNRDEDYTELRIVPNANNFADGATYLSRAVLHGIKPVNLEASL